MRVLVVDDEAPILEAISYNLRKEGHEPLTAADANEAIVAARRERPDLIILDVMLPSGSGFDVCRLLRAESSVPIILLTARAEESDRVVGLELGADDYVTKPFSMRELMARVKSVLRRTLGGPPSLRNQPIRIADIVIDPSRHETSVAGKSVNLTPKEFELLRFLASNPDIAFTRQSLLDRVWGLDAYVGEKTVDVHIRWLREKIEIDPAAPERIITVRGLGYKFSGA